jgi:hypothetical protein
MLETGMSNVLLYLVPSVVFASISVDMAYSISQITTLAPGMNMRMNYSSILLKNPLQHLVSTVFPVFLLFCRISFLCNADVVGSFSYRGLDFAYQQPGRNHVP